MLRHSTWMLFLFAAALPAQTPAAPPAPVAPMTPMTPMTPMAPMPAPMSGNFDRVARIDAIDAEQALSRIDFADVNAQMREAMSNLNVAMAFGDRFNGPVAWARQDPADSLYREARDLLNRGDYRKAADLFKSLPEKFPTSVYIGDAEYWQAFSLYRIGGTPELQQALAVLEARPPAPADDRERDRAANRARATSTTSSTVRVAPRASTNDAGDGRGVGVGGSVGYGSSWGRSRVDAAGLAARIASVLSSRGLAGDPAVKRALAAGGDACDPDDQSVRAEALNALMQNDPVTGRQMAVKILANRDECSVPLRRNAVMLVGSRADDAAIATLIPVARADPSQGVRIEAMQYLMQSSSEAAVAALIDLERSSDDQQVQRDATNALGQSANPRARAEIRAIVENNAANESLRTAALDGFDRDRMTADDAAWLRGVFAKTSSDRIKQRILAVVARAGGDANTQWVAQIVNDQSQPLEVRSNALNYAGRSMDVAALVKMYDVAPERPIREEIISLLSDRKEPEALDKLVDIAKNGTDPSMRREAISMLARSKDPRASKLLLQLVDQK